jgi:O-methyltransferase involved in polyketide biosynthesis
VNLAAGLDTAVSHGTAGMLRWVEVDLPDILLAAKILGYF